MHPQLQALGEKLEVNWDFFRGTVAEDPETIVETLHERLGMKAMSDTKGPPQYDRSIGLWRVREERGTKAADIVVSYGGNQGAAPGVLSRGWFARKVVPLVQEVWGQQAKATRLDSCIDFHGGFAVISQGMNQMHEQRRIARDFYGVPETGQTFYLGAEKAPFRARVYQKGLKELPKMEPEERAFFWDWVRLEAEWHPRSNEQARAMLMSPVEAWGGSKWGRDLLAWVASLNAPKLQRMPRMDRSAEDRLEFAFRQYARTIAEVGRERAHELLEQVLTGELGPVTREELMPRLRYQDRAKAEGTYQ